ncbi:MAG: ribokinase [Firmicutes bacterium]|nr:ribokinase [Bacillota bacterium]
MKILFYGSMNIDHTYEVDHIVAPGETEASSAFRKSAGGKGANQAAAFAKAAQGLGFDIFFAGKDGEDGAFIEDILKSYGIDTSFVARGEATGHAFIQLDKNGQNSIIISGGGNTSITEAEIDGVLEHFGPGDILCMNNEINLLGYLMDRAFEKGMKIVFNPSPITPALAQLPLDKCHLLVVNEIEGKTLSGAESDAYTDILSALAEKYPDCRIVLTAGSEGAYYAFREAKACCPAKDTKAVDTTCAGDTFLGYFLASDLLGMDPESCLEIAAAAAAVTVSRHGAMESVPFRSEL